MNNLFAVSEPKRAALMTCPCQNGGICTTTRGTNTLYCDCPEGKLC